MIDIGERLRSVDPLSTEGIDWTLLKDAADEINKLRAEIERLNNGYVIERAARSEAEAEIERLRAALDIAVKVQREVQDEKERLREYQIDHPYSEVDMDMHTEALNAEIGRLRAKLSLAETAITQFDLDAKEAAAEIKRLREKASIMDIDSDRLTRTLT